MNTNSCSLRQLLMLLCGELDMNQQQRLQSMIRTDSSVDSRWHQLRLASQFVQPGQLVEAEDPLISSGPDSDERDDCDLNQVSQRIAAFIDGALSNQEEEEFERNCWASRRLLSNVIVLFQTQSYQMLGTKGLDSKTTQRHSDLRRELIEIFSATSDSNQVQSETPFRSQPQEAGPVPSPGGVTIVPRPGVKLPRKQIGRYNEIGRYNAVAIAISLAGMIAVVVASYQAVNWYFNTSLPENVVSTDSSETETQSEDSNRNSGTLDRVDPDLSPAIDPRIVNQDRSYEPAVDVQPDLDSKSNPIPQETNPTPGLANGATSPNNEIIPAEREPTIDSMKQPAEVIASAPRGSEKMDAPEPLVADKSSLGVFPPAVPQKILKWNWKEVEGLVAVRVLDSAIWTGALHMDLKSSEENQRPLVAMECKVLPLSWAQLNLNELGSWTMSENTSFTVEPEAPIRLDSGSRLSADKDPIAYDESESSDARDTLARVKLTTGRIGISFAEPESVITVDSPSGRWSIRIADPETELVIEHIGESSVYVVAGSAIINGEELKPRQKLIQQTGGRIERSANNKSVRWLRKPEKRFSNKELADTWLHSVDLFADLGQPDKISAADRPLFRFGLATIDPPSLAKIYLGNEMPDVRKEGVLWLLEFGRDEVQLHALSSQMAIQLGAPSLEQLLPSLVMAIHQRRLPLQADSELLVQGLNHRNAAVRRLSYGLLLHLFGSLVEYDPEVVPNDRIRLSQQWMSAISRLYRRLENVR